MILSWPALLVWLTLGPAPVFSQEFGINQVITKDFDWKRRSTEHFDIYYYPDSEPWVPKAAEYLEKAYQDLSVGLDEKFKQKPPFFLYANVNDFQQSTILAVGDGTGGVTEAFKDRFMVFADGTGQWLEDVVTHELVHVFQFRILLGGFWKSIRIVKTILYPLWVMEGMAEWGTRHQDLAVEHMYLRDAAMTPKGLLSLTKLQNFGHLKPHQITLAYKQGSAAMKFLSREFGKDMPAQVLRLLEQRLEISSVLEDLIGLDLEEFDFKYREYLVRKYTRQARLLGLQEPSQYGRKATEQEGKIPQFNVSPVFTPDGRFMAYFSTRLGHPPEIYLKDLKTGKVKKLVGKEFSRIETISLGNFTNLSRNLAVSPDGKELAFAAKKNHKDYLYFYDLEKERLSRADIPGFMTLAQPAYSPDGKTLAFSGMKEGFTDIYLYDKDSGRLAPLTQDPEDDQSPSFSPDGSWIVYSSEIEVKAPERKEDPGFEKEWAGASHKSEYQRVLYRLSLKDKISQRLPHVGGRSRDPVVSQDGRRILFVSDPEDIYEIYELETQSGEIRRLTRSIGGNFTPAYADGGEIAFSSFRGGSVHVYRGPREKFLSEAFAAVASTRTAEGFPAALGPERPYRFKASTDLFFPALFYSSEGGLFWSSFWQASDLLGIHTTQSFVNYNSGSNFLNYQGIYRYNRFRPQFVFGASGLNESETFDVSGFDFERRIHQQFIRADYPLDRYHRFEFLLANRLEKERLSGQTVFDEEITRLGAVSFVRDTVTGRWLVATEGSRLRLDLVQTSTAFGANQVYQTRKIEAHKFLHTGGLSAFAVRLVGAESRGRNSRLFNIGGVGGVRGYAARGSQNVDSKVAVGALEWRFPLTTGLDYHLGYIFPDFYFKAVFGTFFTDAGYMDSDPGRLRHSVGFGVRFHTFILQLFPLVLSFDWAKRTTDGGNVFYFYLGPVF